MIARAYTYIRWLSLDIVAGAIFVSLFLSRELGVALHANEVFLLGLSVWLIYTLDHLLDVQKATVSTERRAFHTRYRRTLWTLVFIGLVAGGVSCWWLPLPILLAGGAVACFTLVYLLCAPYLRGTKELIGALLYSVGVLLVPIVRGELGMVFPVVILLFLLAFLNLLSFAFLENAEDEQEGFHSFVRQFGKKWTVRLIWMTAGAVFIGCAVVYCFNASITMVLFFLSAVLIHFFLFRFSWFHAHERYRVVGDLVFVMAGVLLFV